MKYGSLVRGTLTVIDFPPLKTFPVSDFQVPLGRITFLEPSPLDKYGATRMLFPSIN